MPPHSLGVKIAHWVTAVAFVALVVSGVAILIAHPRLYWGETGSAGTPSLVDLPLRQVFGPSGWGRSLHFEAAWVAMLTGVVYLRVRRSYQRYDPIQRSVYRAVVFVAGPAMLWTGLAMSPMVLSALPFLATILGGHQSARTLHFAGGLGLIVFLFVHVTRVVMTGRRM